jgi:hypothetical protein
MEFQLPMGFIDILQLVTRINSSCIAISPTLQFTTAHLVFSVSGVFTSPLVTAYNCRRSLSFGFPNCSCASATNNLDRLPHNYYFPKKTRYLLNLCVIQEGSLFTNVTLSKVKIKVMLRPAVILRVLGTSVRQLRVCWCEVPSLTRGRICSLYFQLGLSRAFILGCKSRRTHDHILLSQIWDSPNLEGQVPLLTSPRNRVAQLCPPAQGSATNGPL